MKHVLLIDDNAIDNFINKKVVSNSKMADLITVIDSGNGALAYLNNLVSISKPFPDYIFLDINMPEMGGFEFLDQYDKFPENLKENCSINMLTSSNHPNDIRRANENPNVKNFFNKPLNAEMLTKI